MSIESDRQFEEACIIEVDRGESGWSIKRDDGWSFFVPWDSPVEPKVGMLARFYGGGLGYTVRGLTLDGTTVYYRTEAEEAERLRLEIEENDRRRREEFERNRENHGRRIDALPEPLRKRFRAIQAKESDRHTWESYELFCCEQAVVIADALGSPDAVDRFRDQNWEEQKAAVPGLDEGHSGGTFGGACRLAKFYLESLARA